jgi:hypothetical protein
MQERRHRRHCRSFLQGVTLVHSLLAGGPCGGGGGGGLGRYLRSHIFAGQSPNKVQLRSVARPNNDRNRIRLYETSCHRNKLSQIQ